MSRALGACRFGACRFGACRLVAAALVMFVASCTTSASRAEVITAWREALVSSGLTEADARCITDGFFGSMSNDEVARFQSRDELTPDEYARWSHIAVECE